MSSRPPRHRDARSPRAYDQDTADRGRERRPRSSSRERKASPPRSRRYSRDIDMERERSRDRRGKDDMMPPPHPSASSSNRRRSRGRSRSVEGRSSRADDRSPHRSKRHRHSQSPRHDSHRHKKRHTSVSPADKRCRSRSPGHSSSKQRRSKRPRTKSRSPSNIKHGTRDASRSPVPRSPRKYKSSGRSSHHHRDRSDSRSPRRQTSPRPSSSHRSHPAQSSSYRDRSQHSRRGTSPAPPTRPRGHSPDRTRRAPSKSRYSPRKGSPRRDVPKINDSDYPPRRRHSRSRSPPPYRDRSDRPPPKRARSPLAAGLPYSPPRPRARTPPRRDHSPRRSPPRSSRRGIELFPDRPRNSSPVNTSSAARGSKPLSLAERITDRRDRRTRDDDRTPDTRSRKASPDSVNSPSRRRTPVPDRPRSPRREVREKSPARRSEKSPAKSVKGGDSGSTISESTSANGPYVNRERPRENGAPGQPERSERTDRPDWPDRATDRGTDRDTDRGLGRGADRGADRGTDRGVDRGDRGRGMAIRGRGRGGARGRGLDHHRNQPLHPDLFTPRGRGVSKVRPPTGPSAGRGQTPVQEPTRSEHEGSDTDQRMDEDLHNVNGDRPIPTGPAADQDVDMPPPPERPAVQAEVDQQRPITPTGPFKKVVGAQTTPRTPPSEPKPSGTPFKFTMSLPPKQPKAAKPVPKALDAHIKPTPKFATGSNSAPLGGTIDLSARLSRRAPEPATAPRKMVEASRRERERQARDLRDVRDVRDARDIREARDVRDMREARDVRDIRDTRDVRDMRDTRDGRDVRDARDMRDFRDMRDDRTPRGPRGARDTPRDSPRETPRRRTPPKAVSPTPAPPPPPPPPPPGPEIVYKDMNIYHKVSMVGEGTYGKVYKASNNLTKELVALKRIRMENEKDGFPITAVREMKLLQALKHDNVVSLLEMMVEKSDFYMVFDYMDHDLTGILHHPTFRLEPSHIKHLSYQFFDALNYLHHRGVLHRDIKGSNILLNNDGNLKIADFGLARFYSKNTKKEIDYTNRIITLWYRPPEILLGATAYGPAVDMWSAACVFIELFTRAPAFPGRTEIDQLDIIYDVLGKPTEKVWPALKKMPWYSLLRASGLNKKYKFRNKYKDQIPGSALDLIEQLLQYDPDKRPTAEDCLKHVYFSEDPAPAAPIGLRDLKGDWHEYESKMERRKERDNQKKRNDYERKKAKEAKEAERKRSAENELLASNANKKRCEEVAGDKDKDKDMVILEKRSRNGEVA